tara:strand:+ start:1191 stop:1625 length:435 start_codon:yes stop_codon:yes gene_type:complete
MAEEIFNALIKNDKDAAKNSFVDVIQQKLNTAMDVRRVGMTSNIFNNPSPVVEEDKVVVEEDIQLDEKVSADKFVKGGNDKITQSEVDSLLGKIYDNSKLTKDLIKNKSYQDGESNPKAKNSNKKDTIDFHLFQLGQQVELSRQ